MINSTSIPSSIALQQNESMADFTTLKVGGTAYWFTQVYDLQQFQQTRIWVEKQWLEDCLCQKRLAYHRAWVKREIGISSIFSLSRELLLRTPLVIAK